jgi:hypothetical protein
MRSRISRKCSIGLALGALLLHGAAVAAAADYQAQAFSAPPPEELAAPVRDALSSDAVRVSDPRGPLCEIWLRKALPAQASPTQALEIAYPQLAEGTLVGALRIATQTTDYRSQQIKPGVYTLRYALMPVDGNHYGVAPNRDFLLLVPAAADPSPAMIPRDDLLKLSRKASGTGHGSVWSLSQMDSPPAAVPSLAHQEDPDTWVLYFRVPLERGSAPLTMGLIVVGHAPES